MNTFIPQQIYSPISNPQIIICQPPSSQQYVQLPLTSQFNIIPNPGNTTISAIPVAPLNANNFFEIASSGYEERNILSNTNYPNNMKNSNIINTNDVNIRYALINNNISPYQTIPTNYVDNIEFINSNNNDNFNVECMNKSDEFKTSIRLFIQHLELNEGEQSITAPSIALGIKRRRLYDVVNVFESIGCCKKCALDSVIWIGKSNIKSTFEILIKQKNLFNPKNSLADLFPIDQCIGVSHLTTSFVLLFYALKTDHLDLRYVAHFFSRKSSRYKTTLCKLYQISYIMNAIELVNRTSQVCEVVISNGYFNVDIIPDINDTAKDLVSIQSLLINNENEEMDLVMKRRKEFKQYFSENMKQ